MLTYAILTVVWIVVVVPAIRSRLVNEIYAHCGLAIELTMPVLSIGGIVAGLDIAWLRWVGYAMCVPAAAITAASLYELKWRIWCEAFWPDRPEPGDIVDSGIYGLVRHPTFLGAALWAIALGCLFQSVANFALAPIAVLCFRLASRAEEQFNIRKLGDDYRDYASRVPLWNIFAGLLRRGSRQPESE